MSDVDPSKEELRAEVEALKAQVEEKEAALDDLRTSHRLNRRLLATLVDATFSAAAHTDGTVEGVWSGDVSLDDDVLHALLTNEPARHHCQRVLSTGEPSSFEVVVDDRPWQVYLAPDESRDESGRLCGVVQASRRTPSDRKAVPSSVALSRRHVDERPPWSSSNRNATPSDETSATASHTDDTLAHTEGTSATAEDTREASHLHETHALHRELVELLPDAILVVDGEDRIRYANTAAVRMVGTDSVDALLGTSIWTFVHPGSRERTRERKHRLRRGSRVDFSESRLVRTDGETVPVEMASVPITFRGRPAALTAVRDVTGRERMAETIAQTLDLFDKAFHLGPAALLIARLRDGLILEASDRMVQLGGLSSDALIGQSLDDLDAGVASAVQADLLHDLLHDRSVTEREVCLQRADGTERITLCSARLIEVDGDACALVSLVDITERKRAALAERESRTLLDKIFRASPAPISICRLDDGRYLEVNEAMCSLVGYSCDEMTGHTSDDLDLWVDRTRRTALMEQLRHEDAVYDFEAEFRRASGDVVTTLCSFQRIQVDGEPCVLGVMTDITGREEARQALVEAKEKAEEVAHFRSAVLSNMTHEVRTPLTVILGFTSMLREGVKDEYRRFVNLIERSGRRLLLTLDSLLDLAQLESGTLELDAKTQCVCDAVHGVTGSLEHLVDEKDLDFTLDLPSEHLYARVDHELFGRVMNHLVDNAVKFTNDGTVVVRVSADDECVYVDVEDTGRGITESFQPRVFEAFAQESEGLARTHQGSGLGLTVSKRIVECLGGTISVKSAEDEGTVVTVALPRVEHPSRTLGANADSRAEPPFP